MIRALTSILLACLGLIFLPSGQAEAPASGKELFEKRCGGCHSADRDKEGPRLRGVYGRRSGAVASFHYSDALKKTQIVWDASALDKWLSGPESMVPDTDMDFRIASSDERREIIAYLKELKAR